MRLPRRRPVSVALAGAFEAGGYGAALYPLLAGDALRARLGRRARVLGFDEREIGECDLLVVGIGGEPESWLVPTLTALAAGVPVAWNAPAVGELPESLADAIGVAVAGVGVLGVRDEESARRLAERAGRRPDVVPDPVFALVEDPRTVLGPEARPLVEPAGGEIAEYAVVQAAALEPAEWRAAAEELAGRGLRSLELPLRSGDRLGGLGTLTAPEPPSPRAVVELVANAGAVVGTDFHLGATAVAFGVPFACPPGSAAAAVPGASVLGRDEIGTPGAGPTQAARALRERVEARWDAVARLAGDGAPAVAAGDAAAALERLRTRGGGAGP